MDEAAEEKRKRFESIKEETEKALMRLEARNDARKSGVPQHTIDRVFLRFTEGEGKNEE